MIKKYSGVYYKVKFKENDGGNIFARTRRLRVESLLDLAEYLQSHKTEDIIKIKIKRRNKYTYSPRVEHYSRKD